jgi:outer membrane lipoprotein carrier protein
MANEKFWCLNEMNKLPLPMNTFQTCYAALLSVVVVMLVPFSAHANSVDTLAQFLKNTHSGRAEFKQVVTSPSKTGQPVRSKQSAGSFAFMRPAKFRFEYQKPFPQLIVADGQTLWFYDTDLAQVTARKQSQALNSTPAALIATATDLAALQKDFTLQAQPDADGLQWVQATPNNKDSTLSQVRLGLSVSGQQVALAKLDIVDAMGQRSVLSFERFDVNPIGLTAAAFNFVPPKGVDVVRP